jgi:osmotically-inducible protein OsmY
MRIFFIEGGPEMYYREPGKGIARAAKQWKESEMSRIRATIFLAVFSVAASAQTASTPETKSDRMTTAAIRKAIEDDKAYSAEAHNVEVITHNGEVTMRGSVRSENERKDVLSKAIGVTHDVKKVHDELTVRP